MMKCCNSRERPRGQHCAKDSSRGFHSRSSAARFLGSRERRRDLRSGLIVERVCPSSVFGRLSEYPSDGMFSAAISAAIAKLAYSLLGLVNDAN
jgi:hypothetical protein